MPSLPATTRPGVLLLCEDPVGSALLRTLLRALPAPQPELFQPDQVPAGIDPLARRCSLCFLELGYAGLPLPGMLGRLRAAAPELRVIGLLGEGARQGDRADLVRALQGGLEQVLMIEDLSVARLEGLLRHTAPRLGLGMPILAPRPLELPLSQGGWRITLAEQRAAFDAATLAALGHPVQGGAGGLGDWKALIHPDDVDRLVSEVQHVLEGSAPPHQVSYRLRRGDGSWLQVVSDEISVELDAGGAPRAIEGRFYTGEDARAAPTAPAATAPAQAPIAEQCQTALSRYRRDEDGVFRLAWCNAAAAVLESATPESLRGRRADQVAPACDGFDLEEALVRVHETGIAETRDALLLERTDPPVWRRFHLGRLGETEVLVEQADISELMNARHARRTQDELARHVARSLPVTTLLVDERGRVVQCLTLAPGPLGEDATSIEERTVQELLGPAGGAACLQQVERTLNTGRTMTVTYLLEGAHAFLECHSSLLRALPGLPPRVVLALLDVSQREQELGVARALGAQLRAALASIPLPLFLKDAEGRYIASNAAFERLMGVEPGMLNGKTDFEIFPDDLAAELHTGERRMLGERLVSAEYRGAGVGAARGPHWCFEYPVLDGAGLLLGCGGLWLSPAALPDVPPEQQGALVRQFGLRRGSRGADIHEATAEVINRVEDALADNGDYSGVLRQLEQLVETTMHAQALIHTVAGQSEPPLRPLVALAPLAREIVELERILVPPSAHFENHIDDELPPARCEPVAFHQILLRAIRHARRTLGNEGTLCIRLRASRGGGRGCLSCHEGFDGHYVELVIEDTDSRLAEEDIAQLVGEPAGLRSVGSALDDLAEIHGLAHAQGGHLQIQRNVPSGTSVHVFFRAGDPAELSDSQGRLRSTVTRLPLGRNHGRG